MERPRPVSQRTVLVYDDARIIHGMYGPGRWGVGGWGRPGPADRGLVGDHRPVCNCLLPLNCVTVGLRLSMIPV